MISDDDWHFVTECLADMQKQSERFGSAVENLMIAPESPLVDPMGRTEGMLIAALSRLICDESESLAWFVYECDFGRNPKQAGFEGNMKLIDSIETLRELITEADFR